METMKVAVNIPQSVALAAGRRQYGRTYVEPTDEQLAALTDEQRDVLSRHLEPQTDSRDALQLTSPIAD